MSLDQVAAMEFHAKAIEDFYIKSAIGMAFGTSVAVFLRFLAKSRTEARITSDDVMCAFSLLPLWCLVVIGVVQALYGGMGVPNQLLTLPQLHVFLI